MKPYIAVMLSLFLGAPVVNGGPSLKKEVSPQECSQCSTGEFQGKISQQVEASTLKSLLNVRIKTGRGTVQSSDIRIAASNLDLMFKHFDEVKGADGESYTTHMERGLYGMSDMIIKHVGSIDDAVALQKKMASFGVSLSVQDALSAVQRSPKDREAALQNFKKTGGMKALRNLLIHNLHMQDVSLRAKLDGDHVTLAQWITGGCDPTDPTYPTCTTPYYETPGGGGGALLADNFWWSLDLGGFPASGIFVPPTDPCISFEQTVEVFSLCCLFTSIDPFEAPCCIVLAAATLALIGCQSYYA